MTGADMAYLELEINSPDEARRLYAVQDAESDDALLLARTFLDRLVKESSAAVRAAIAFRLKTMDATSVYPEIFHLFRSPDAYLRNAAVEIFGAGGERASDFLGRRAGDADREVRKFILDALIEIGDDQARETIRQALQDPAINVQVTAVEYLGQLEDGDAAPLMVELLRTNPEPMLTLAVLDALTHPRRRDVIAKALKTLAPDSDYSRIDDLYLPQILELLAISGQGPEMIQVMIALPDQALYAENLVRAASYYFETPGSEIVNYQLAAKLMALVVDESVDAEQQFLAGRMLAAHGPGRMEPEALFTLGERLAEVVATAPVGLELIAASGHQGSRERLKAFALASTDRMLVEICREILAGAEPSSTGEGPPARTELRSCF
ncbi:MAG: HEAT repeat domain-containing protein [Pseudomonadota bacterium]